MARREWLPLLVLRVIGSARSPRPAELRCTREGRARGAEAGRQGGTSTATLLRRPGAPIAATPDPWYRRVSAILLSMSLPPLSCAEEERAAGGWGAAHVRHDHGAAGGDHGGFGRLPVPRRVRDAHRAGGGCQEDQPGLVLRLRKVPDGRPVALRGLRRPRTLRASRLGVRQKAAPRLPRPAQRQHPRAPAAPHGDLRPGGPRLKQLPGRLRVLRHHGRRHVRQGVSGASGPDHRASPGWDPCTPVPVLPGTSCNPWAESEGVSSLDYSCHGRTPVTTVAAVPARPRPLTRPRSSRWHGWGTRVPCWGRPTPARTGWWPWT